jgi:hypothetical protein
MARVLIDHVRSGLDELSDLDYQSRVWTGREPAGEMSSFEESVATLFDDSGLGWALDKDEPVFGQQIDAELRELRAALVKIDSRRSPDDVIDDPRMPVVREQAAAILRAIEDSS